MNWISVRDKLPATEKQLKLIADMEEFVSEKFRGKTRAEASAWIEGHMELFKLLTMDTWALEHGYFKGSKMKRASHNIHRRGRR